MARTEEQKQLEEMTRQEQAESAQAKSFAGPKPVDLGLSAGGDVAVKQSQASKFEEMKSKFTTEDHRRFQRIQRGK